ncbi:MAG: PQQ-dependent sugar dehydrogenase, partial [Gammaproteobacteria bacterium]|nr:PQQ-dependent sugar dehydrogenase [Gammaproteobacteria bacterium]
KISYFAKDVENARQMALSDNGVIYVGSRGAGKVHALKDTNNDGVADKKWLIAEGLFLPSGLAWKDGSLYVAEVNKILEFKDIDNNLDKPVSEVFLGGLPDERHHGWKFIRFGPNGQLYFPVGAPCNVCDCEVQGDKNCKGKGNTKGQFSRIFSVDLKTKKITEIAQGVRNSVGFDFHPDTQDVWFSDNGRDMMGDDIPACELNRVSQNGEHFGFPYFHASDVADPEYAKGKKQSNYTPPALELGAHTAPLGIHFYTGSQFPESYSKKLFVAEHGSWNRTKKSGYKVGIATIENNKVVKYETFIDGFMINEETFGRPVAFVQMPDGSLLISDDYDNAIYRVTYQGK